ncbi:MAG TPA: DUF5691 domain-containing protein [Pyrinomonadaceae bacterium]|nr:DUF5691 domain-containing protein [Pyrinomonadaceae bacterium]
MQLWDDILATAVVGTEQRELKLAVREGELGSLLTQIDNTDREASLLSAASVVALYRSAGVAPPVDTQSLPEACDQDETSRSSIASGQHLALMLDGEFTEVLPEWLAAMSRARKRVSEEQLPALLDHGHMETSLRHMIAGVIGKRGEWLATQNPNWQYATRRGEKELWETGSREERLLLLEHLRTADPTKARELLATTWTQEPAKDRVSFLEKLAIGVSSADEPFLNEALHDRSVEVRRAVRPLLAALPNSDFSQRLQALAKQVASFKKPLIGKARIEVVLPEDPIAWLKTNDIEIDGPPRNATQSIGPKAWALKELISLIPVAYWSKLWQKTATEIIRAGDESEWRESFVLGFVAAARRDRDPDWLEALVRFTSADPQQPPLLDLAAYLPAARLEALIVKALGSEAAEASGASSAFQVLMLHRNAWSDQLSRDVLTSIKKRIKQGTNNVVDWQIKAVLKQSARYISPALYDELASDWPTDSESWASWSKPVSAFQSLLAFRRDMHRAISENETLGG